MINRNYSPEHVVPDPITNEEKLRLIIEARHRFAVSPYHPYISAAIEAIEVVTTLPFEVAVRQALALFVPLVFDPHTRNKIHFFFLFSRVGPHLVKVDSSKAPKTERIAIVGAGLMGQGIAQVAAERSIQTILMDKDEATVRKSAQNIDRTLTDLVHRGRWSSSRKDALMKNIAWARDESQLKDLSVIIESVIKELPLKKEILARIQRANSSAIFVSNTSTLPIGEISDGSQKPEHIVGMYFFLPFLSHPVSKLSKVFNRAKLLSVP